MENLKLLNIDNENINLVIKYYVLESNKGESNFTFESGERRIKSLFNIPNSLNIILYNNDKPVGLLFSTYHYFDDIDLLSIDEILIFEEYRNKGYGFYLVKEVEKIARDNGVSKISLQTTNSKMHQKFYNKSGFLKNDFLINMKKDI